jgi:Zn finger protein HypA/HybF involved in hydrogenase expression
MSTVPTFPALAKVACKKCKTHLQFDAAVCGLPIECPNCGSTIRLPLSDKLRPVGEEITWEDDEGLIRFVKCPSCHRMVPITHEDRGSIHGLRFILHERNSGVECSGSYAAYAHPARL